MAAVFFGYGERSYIGVHDNMDLFLAQFQMLKNTDSFWKHGVDVPFLGGVSRDNLPSELSLYSLLFMIFPTYTAYVLGLLGKILIGMFSFRLLAGELLGEPYKKYRPAVYMTGFAYGICWFFPAYGFAFASIPLCVWLLLKIYKGEGEHWYGWYAALFAYPLLSYFSYHGIFILGYLALVVLWLFGRGHTCAEGKGGKRVAGRRRFPVRRKIAEYVQGRRCLRGKRCAVTVAAFGGCSARFLCWPSGLWSASTVCSDRCFLATR